MMPSVKYIEHQSVTTKLLHLPSPSPSPKILKISVRDDDATDSSGDEDDSPTSRPRFVKHISEIRFQKNQPEIPAQPAVQALGQSLPQPKIQKKSGNRVQSEKPPKYISVRKRPWGKYVAEIRYRGKRSTVWLGSFDTAEEAAMIYDKAALLIRGPDAKINFHLPPLPESVLPSISMEIEKTDEVAAQPCSSSSVQRFQRGGHDVAEIENKNIEDKSCGAIASTRTITHNNTSSICCDFDADRKPEDRVLSQLVNGSSDMEELEISWLLNGVFNYDDAPKTILDGYNYVPDYTSSEYGRLEDLNGDFDLKGPNNLLSTNFEVDDFLL